MVSSIFLYLLGSIFLLALIISSWYRHLSQPENAVNTPGISHIISQANPEEIGKRVVFSQAKAMKSREGQAICSLTCPICLADYKETDLLRQLRHCQHFFHLACVDPWLPQPLVSGLPELSGSSSLTSFDQDGGLRWQSHEQLIVVDFPR